jgi:DNA-binding transcriptional LysR family regulator
MRAEAEGQGRVLKARLQVRGFDAIAQLVEAGLGVAVMPAAVAQRFAQLFRVKVLTLNEPWAQRDYLLVVRTQDVLPTVVQRFVDALCPAKETPDRQSAPAGGLKP